MTRKRSSTKIKLLIESAVSPEVKMKKKSATRAKKKLAEGGDSSEVGRAPSHQCRRREKRSFTVRHLHPKASRSVTCPGARGSVARGRRRPVGSKKKKTTI